MKAIEAIEVSQLREALTWALDRVRKEFKRTPEQIAAKPQGVISFASARILYTDEMDFPAGDQRLDERLRGEFAAVFTEWVDRQ